MVFQPGQSGNPGGRPKIKQWRDALIAEVLKPDEETGKPNIEVMAAACVKAAKSGDASAYKEIGDRLDGKVPQQNILMGDEDGGAVKFERVERVIVRPDAANTNGGSVPGLPAARAV